MRFHRYRGSNGAAIRIGGKVMMQYVQMLVIGAAITVLSAAAYAQKQPTISDIATCNKDADAAAGIPSASPRLPDSAPGTPGRTPDAHGGVLADRGPAGRSSASSGGTVAGPTDSTGQITTNPSDPRLEGMAAARANDETYRAAYRACMQRLGY
jgi:hypothetical protein